MIIDAVDLSDLPESAELAFIEFEKRLRDLLDSAQHSDRQAHTDQNGNYFGHYLPDRYYVSSVLAFLDEYNLELDVPDISELPDDQFLDCFSQFFNKINYAKTRFSLRRVRFEKGEAGTPLVIAPSYKEQIGKLLATIRKIANQEIADKEKREAVIRKINALQVEVDREIRTVDAVFGLLLDVSKTIGECADNVEPLIEKLERLKNLFFEGTTKQVSFPAQERPKLLPQQKNRPFGLDDDIPF